MFTTKQSNHATPIHVFTPDRCRKPSCGECRNYCGVCGIRKDKHCGQLGPTQAENYSALNDFQNPRTFATPVRHRDGNGLG